MTALDLLLLVAPSQPFMETVRATRLSLEGMIAGDDINTERQERYRTELAEELRSFSGRELCDAFDFAIALKAAAAVIVRPLGDLIEELYHTAPDTLTAHVLEGVALRSANREKQSVLAGLGIPSELASLLAGIAAKVEVVDSTGTPKPGETVH